MKHAERAQPGKSSRKHRDGTSEEKDDTRERAPTRSFGDHTPRDNGGRLKDGVHAPTPSSPNF